MTWEMRPIPVSDRGPIAVKTLEMIEEAEIPVTLGALDQMDCFGLIHENGSGEELRGLCWLVDSPNQENEGTIPLLWIDDIDFNAGAATAYEQLRATIDEWAREHGFDRVTFWSRNGYKKAKKMGVLMGFKASPLREFFREVKPE